jgi:hypothetical protein
VDVLLEAWETSMGAEYRESLLRALSLSRDDRAVEFLKKLVVEGGEHDVRAARAALELFPDSSATSG